ncbi:radical SAM protein [Leptolyngbya sp. 15MV]|nr:radical SAM protein [Leptolyngbya sp. 15MV]
MGAATVYLETFGCQMNELDSELVAGALTRLGYRFTADADAASVVLYNTCSVREHAEQKVWSRLGELAVRKRREPGLVVGVLGCMAERDGTDLIRRMPVVDLLVGPGELDKLPALLDNAVRTRASLLADAPSGAMARPAAERSAGLVALQGSSSRRSATLSAAADSLEMLDLSRSISPVDGQGAKRSAYVRITRGCNKFCTYCVVPFTRGAEVHRPPDHIVEECRRLADAGVVEVTLLGQTVNHYRFEHGAAVTIGGVVQPQKGRSYRGGHRRDPFKSASTTTFADLLAMIHEKVPQIRRLRFVTSYPRDFGDDVLEVMRDHPRICRYLHVPGQSGSDAVLKAMTRGYTSAEYLEFPKARQRASRPTARVSSTDRCRVQSMQAAALDAGPSVRSSMPPA